MLGLPVYPLPFFSPKFKSSANFSAPAQERNLFFLSGRSARKKIHNFSIKSSHLRRTSRHVWLSFSACDHCCAYQLICIMTISTYTTGARAKITRQLGSCTVKSACTCRVSANYPNANQLISATVRNRHWTKARRASKSGTNGSI